MRRLEVAGVDRTEALAYLGGFLCLAGLASALLYFLGLNVRALVFVDRWGPELGWSLRGLVLAVGVALVAATKLASD